jgi:alanyl-tRNA synthetase
VKFVSKIVSGVHPKELKAFIDEINQTIGSGVVVLASDKDDKASIVVGVTPDLTDKYSAVELVRVASAVVGGKGGGGRPDMAQAGGPDATKLEQALEAVKNMI